MLTVFTEWPKIESLSKNVCVLPVLVHVSELAVMNGDKSAIEFGFHYICEGGIKVVGQ